jgi:hypothetical protein
MAALMAQVPLMGLLGWNSGQMPILAWITLTLGALLFVLLQGLAFIIMLSLIAPRE